jgi:hypothetical protein
MKCHSVAYLQSFRALSCVIRRLWSINGMPHRRALFRETANN